MGKSRVWIVDPVDGTREYGEISDGRARTGWAVHVAVAHGLHCSRMDGSPLVYNQAYVYMPDLFICRKEYAELDSCA